jgi:hypothetical protein
MELENLLIWDSTNMPALTGFEKRIRVHLCSSVAEK